MTHAGERTPSLHPGDHVQALIPDGTAARDPADGDTAEELPAAEHRAAGHAGAAAPVHTRKTG